MVELSPETWKRLRIVFRPEDQSAAAALLEQECGGKLPLVRDATPESLERLRFAAMRISGGTLDGLQKAVALAKRDWRDLLMASGFGCDLTAHREWLADA